MTQVRAIHGEAAFATLAQEWDVLAQRSMTNTPFQQLAYQKSWWENLRPQAGRLHTITVRDDDGQLQAIASLYNNNGALFFNGCIEETDYLDLITPPDFARTAWEEVFKCLCSADFPSWQTIDLCNVPAASPTRDILSAIAGDLGFAYTQSVHEVCPIIKLPASFDAYLDQIDSKQRREINRKLRRAMGADVKILIVQPEDDLTAQVDEFLDLLQKSTFEKREWLNEGRRQVFHDTAIAAAQAGMLNLMFAEVEGRKAAALFNFEYEGRLWVYNSGLDPDSYSALSLGVVITAKAIEYAISRGLSSFDFLRGNETYKYRFGAEDTEIFRCHLEPKST